jgi:hypothetical protein
MAASRGDRKPCTELPCTGRMQFGREPQCTDAAGHTLESGWAWLCDSNPAHIRRVSGSASAAATSDEAASEAWDDDGAPPAGARSPNVASLSGHL